MCVVCVMWEKGKLTAAEADKALVELLSTDSSSVDLYHAQDVMSKIEDSLTDSSKV